MKRILSVGPILLLAPCIANFALPTAMAEDEKGSLLGLPGIRDYRIDPYLKIAAELQDLGQQKAGEKLMEYAKQDGYDDQVIILCRLLFVAKRDESFRRPLIGASHFVGRTEYGRWPLEPIELVDGVPFLITRGYTLVGEAESAAEYLRHCQTKCDWSSARVGPKSKEEKKQALAKLLASPKFGTPVPDRDK